MGYKLSCALVLLSSWATVKADAPFSMCTDNVCTNCPTSVTSDGTGYPACVTYNTGTIVDGQGFTGSGSGGYTVYFDIAQPGEGCATIIKSPASTDMAGCGYTVGGFKNAVCAAIDLKETFMVQFCCGSGDCTAAGVGARSVRGIDYRSAAVGRGLTIKYTNGTEIEPLQIGYPPEMTGETAVIDKRASCSSYSPSGDVYTIPAPSTQIVGENLDGGTGGGSFAVTATREQSFSTTLGTSAGIEGIISASVSVTFEQSISDSKAYTFNIPAGESGQLGFTSTLKCSDGTIVCSDGTFTGTSCTGFEQAGYLAGTYAVIATS